MRIPNRVVVIGYGTYDSQYRFIGGTEIMTDTLIRYFISKKSIIRYYVIRKLTSDLIRIYTKEYNCELFSRKELSVDSIREFNPDLVLVSICSNSENKDICKNIISKINRCPVLIYGHGPNCCNINNYDEDVKNDNYYFTSLSEVEHHSYIKFGIREDHITKIINPVLLNSNNKYDNSKIYDAFSNSRLVEQKGIRNAVDFCKELNYRLSMVGNASSTNSLLKYSKNILGDKLDYLGVVNRDEINYLICHSKFLIYFPNYQEGESPLSVLESMSLGTPVITWDDFGITNIVNKKYNIVLDHSRNYIDQFKEEYLDKLDKYLSEDNKNDLIDYTNYNFGLKSFYKKLDEIISGIQS